LKSKNGQNKSSQFFLLIRGCLIIFALTIIFLELSSWLLFENFTGKNFDIKASNLEREARIIELNKNITSNSKKLFRFHPYLGYAGVPGAHPWGKDSTSFNDFGMLSIPNHLWYFLPSLN